jgi:ADP-heptose:LPS heptosyltransferase
LIKLNKILVIQTSFIGDVILSTSLLETLHASYPDANIDVLVRKGSDSIFEGHPFINNVLVWDKKGGKYKNLLSIIKNVRSERYDLIVNPHRFASSGIICTLSKATKTVGFKKNPLSFLFSESLEHDFDGRHEISRNHALIQKLVGNDTPTKPKLYPQSTDFEKVKGYKEEAYRCFTPTSVWFTKQWRAEQWIELIDNMPHSEHIYLLGAPSDKTQCEEIATKSKHPNIKNLSGSLSLLQSAALMQDAKMNYVNDSAPMHLCSSTNAPTTVIYCSTIPAFGFGPLSDDARIIETTENLDCRPCGLHGHEACPKGHFKCSTTISLSQFDL